MKKEFALTLVLTAALTLLCACNDPTQPTEKPISQPQTESNVKESVVEKESGKDDSYSIALMIPGNLGDKSFFDATYQSIGLLEEKLGVTVDHVEAGTDTAKYYGIYVDLCEQDYDLILTVSSTGNDTLLEIAQEFPEQKFINLDDRLETPPSNLFVMAPKSNEMSFLVGAVAALKAEELMEDTIGFIGGMDIPGINEFLVGYIEGAQYIRPDIKISSSYVGSFTDTAKGKENAILMYNSGVSVIFAAAGQSGLGVIDAAKEKGTFVIGVDSDQAMALKDSQPELAETIITSAVKNIDIGALYIVEKAMKGEMEFGNFQAFGIAEGVVGIAENEYYEKLMSEENRKRVEELEEKVKKKEVAITDTIGMSNEDLIAIRDSARPR